MTGSDDLAPAPSTIQLGILGPMSANIGGIDVNLGGVKQRAVLAMLVLGKTQQVTADRLIDALWPGEQPRNAPAALQAYVSHLRRALAPGSAARSRGDLIVSQAQGYALHLGEGAVDSWAFESAMGAASATRDPGERASTLRSALSLWRGAALLDFADDDWARAEAQRLTELRSIGQEQLIAARLELGESSLVVPDIQTLLDTEPLREERWRLLALALYRSQRQAEALAALRRARTMLADELGLDPGPALQSLERQILEHAEALELPSPRTESPRVDQQAPAPLDDSPMSELVDRDEELDRLRQCLDDALAGRSGLALVEGAAGIGKSALLAEARVAAQRRSMRVLSARGSQLEKEYGFGALRQIFDPVLLDATRRAEVLDGAAATAAAVFDATAGADSAQPEGLFSVLHGAYWMTVNLSAAQPIAILVDDLQWCDSGSLRFLAYLVRRLEGLPIAVVATLRTGEAYDDEELVAELVSEPTTVMIAPEPLSEGGVAELVRDELGEGADAAFAHACHRTTAGNPLLLRQLLRALEADRIRPIAANADTVRAIGSRAVSSLVLRRFLRMSSASRAVARAVSVLGDGASLPTVADLAGLDEPQTASGVSALARAEVLRADHPIGFVHPLVEAAVYNDIPTGERELQHERAAEVLAASGAPPERVAAQLMHGPHRGNDAAVQTLRDAARREVERGAAESAIAYLTRALREPPSAKDLPYVQLELGQVETMANGPAAVEHLSAAYEQLQDPALRAETAVQLVRTLVFAAARGQATQTAAAAVADTPDSMLDARQHLIALERISGYMHDLEPTDYGAYQPPELAGTGVGARALAATLAWECLVEGRNRQRAVELASFAIEDGALQQVDTGLLWVVAGNTLGLSGVDTTKFWTDALSDAYSRGGLFAVLGIHLWHGFYQWQCGDLRESYQSFLSCTEQNELWGAASVGQPYVDAFLIRVLLDRGDLAAARAHLDLTSTRDPIGEGLRLCKEAEALVLIAEGRPAEALDVVEQLKHLMRVVRNPVWRSAAVTTAPALAALGRRDDAVAVVESELVAARQWGTPALTGARLRLLGELKGADGTAELEESVDLLGQSSARLELARALAALASQHAHARGDTDPEVVRLRRRALHLAHACGADAMASQVSELLWLAGIQVGYAPTIETTLTSSELKIARLAAGGALDREIAQSLFVTARSVQLTVESVCTKLGVDSLAALRDVLAEA